jgi:hypothetical protein
MEQIKINQNMNEHYRRMNVLNEMLIYFVTHEKYSILFKELIPLFKELLPTFKQHLERTEKYELTNAKYDLVINNDKELGEFVCYCVEKFIEENSFIYNNDNTGLRLSIMGYYNGVELIKKQKEREEQTKAQENVRQQVFASITQ